MANIYCGNSYNDPDLVAGNKVVGTNYECLRKGIGVGLHQPYNNAYAQPPNPIDARRFYCGNNPVAPAGYFATGSPSKCLQIGVGLGKAQRAALGPPAFMYFIRFVLPYILFVVLSGTIFLILYFLKPNFVTKKKDNKRVIDLSKFIPYYLLFCLLLGIIIWFIWKRFIRRWI